MFECFKKPKREVPKIASRLKVGLVVGHTRLRQGAKNVFGISEYNFWSKNALIMKAELETMGFDCVIIKRDVVGIKGAYKKAVKEHCDIVLELHFNSASPAAKYTLTLSSYDSEDYRLAKHIQLAMTKYMKRPASQSHKIWKMSKSDRGGRSTSGFSGPNVLIEPFFGSNKEDCIKFDKDVRKFSKNIGFAIGDFLKWQQ